MLLYVAISIRWISVRFDAYQFKKKPFDYLMNFNFIDLRASIRAHTMTD